jgi:hypothetical protein
VSSIPTPLSRGKPADSVTTRSTGTCPAEWRLWWRAENIRVGTDWKTIIESAELVLRRLRKQHLAVSS